MIGRLPLLAVAIAVAGCFSSTDASREDSEPACEGDPCDCDDAPCVACEGGGCASCAPGACPPVEQPDPVTAPADVDVHETYSLAQGLALTTWTFEAGPGASGHAAWTLQDLATHSVALSADLCLRWHHEGPQGTSNGTRGTCNGDGLGVSGSTDARPLPIAEWETLEAGIYTVTAAGQPQANELLVEITIDNP